MGTEVVSREVDNFFNSKNLLNVNDIDGIEDKDTKVIKMVKGNIPFNQKLLNKYKNVTEMMEKQINNYDGIVKIKDNIEELKNVNLDKMSSGEIKKLAIDIFEKYNNKKSFYNNENKIEVSNGDIKESIQKIFGNGYQKKLLNQHLKTFSELGNIIEHATLGSQNIENKENNNRKENLLWSYYLDGLRINGNDYLFEFDVVSRDNGENHYRVQRLRLNEKKASVPTGNVVNNNITPAWGTSASDNNIAPNKEDVK
jgi:hypothetical protein